MEINMKMRKNVDGFTLMEVLSVILFISFLIGSGLYIIDFSSKKDSVNLVLLDKFIYRDMPQALLQAYYAKGNTFTSIKQTDITVTGDVGTTTYNQGYSWQIDDDATQTNKITIVINLTSSAKAQNTSDRINVGGNIESKVVDGNNVKVVYAL